ncbi:MAG: hypothetical protein HOP03_15835 [Lysobacter sp.]|nr:hypothetical protein [Lysobacter sp.]
MTRRLIASTVMSESHGGDPAATNRLGFVGRYKAGAEFLAEAGYVDRDKLGQAMAGQKSEWAWAKSGGMAAFLQDASHWTSGLSLDAYKRSPELQDNAFKLNAEKHHQRALEQGFLGEDEKPGRVAGFLKAAHIVGFNSAREAMTGGRAYRDANGVSNYDRIHDISRNGDGLDKLMTAMRPDASETSAGKTAAIASVAHPDHPEHGRYREMYAALASVPGLSSDQERQRAAASMMVATIVADMPRVDHVVAGPGGAVFAVQGDLRDVSHKILPLNLAQLASQPIETSTAQLGVLAPPQTSPPRNPHTDPQSDPHVDATRQERARAV